MEWEGFITNWDLNLTRKIIKINVNLNIKILTRIKAFFGKSYSITQVLLIYLIFIPVFFAWKVLIVFVRRLFVGDIPFRNYVLIGRNVLSEDIRKYYLINFQEGYRFKGYFIPESTESLLNNLKEFCSNNEVHEVYYCVENPSKEQLQQLVNFGLDSLIKVKLITGSSHQRQSIQLDKFDQAPGIDVSILPLDEWRNQILKRIFDIGFSVIFLVTVFSWLYPIVFVLIKINSRGPVFFIQRRNGLKNKPFGCIKFRTMTFETNAEFSQAKKNDPRITGMGRFLRKSSLDEFPQFINVFLGDMSLIGPRPHPIKLNEEFSSLIANLMSRHYVKPGITGLAQAMGYRGETQTLAEMENRIRLDRYYIENWSFWLDIKIIFLTIISLIRGSEKAF